MRAACEEADLAVVAALLDLGADPADGVPAALQCRRWDVRLLGSKSCSGNRILSNLSKSFTKFCKALAPLVGAELLLLRRAAGRPRCAGARRGRER